MTKAEYAEYQQAVADFFEREGIANLFGSGESFFSWCPCDCCGRPEGGDREEASGYNPTTEKSPDIRLRLPRLHLRVLRRERPV